MHANVHDPRSCQAAKSHSVQEAFEFLKGRPLGSRTWVFTVARNPFDQASSFFFQGILHDIERHLNATPVTRLMNKFHAQLLPIPTRWWTQHLVDPFGMNFFEMTEAPKGFTQKLRDIGCESSSMKSNVLAISDVMVKCRSRADTQLMGNFYKHFFQAAVTALQYSCMVHFSPAKELHQTLTFREDATCPPYTDLGSMCIYLKADSKFHLTYVKCSQAGIVESPATWEEAEKAQEFVIRAVVDPDSGRELLPLRTVVRTAAHIDCLVVV